MYLHCRPTLCSGQESLKCVGGGDGPKSSAELIFGSSLSVKLKTSLNVARTADKGSVLVAPRGSPSYHAVWPNGLGC